MATRDIGRVPRVEPASAQSQTRLRKCCRQMVNESTESSRLTSTYVVDVVKLSRGGGLQTKLGHVATRLASDPRQSCLGGEPFS